RNAAATTPTSATPAQSNSPTSAMWFAVHRNGLSTASQSSPASPFAVQSSANATPAMPAAPPRPRNGASTNARPPKDSALTPSQAAKPIDPESGTGSPSAAL